MVVFWLYVGLLVAVLAGGALLHQRRTVIMHSHTLSQSNWLVRHPWQFMVAGPLVLAPVTVWAIKLDRDAVEWNKEQTRAMFEREERDREREIHAGSARAKADLERLGRLLPAARQEALAHLRGLSAKDRAEMMCECRPDPLSCPFPPALIMAAGASARERSALAMIRNPPRFLKAGRLCPRPHTR